MKEITRLETPPPTCTPKPSSLLVPYTPASTIRYAYLITDSINNRKIVKRQVIRYTQGTITQSAELRVAKRDLYNITKAAESHTKRQQTDQGLVQKGGVIYAKDAREAVITKCSGIIKGTSKGGADGVASVKKLHTAPLWSDTCSKMLEQANNMYIQYSHASNKISLIYNHCFVGAKAAANVTMK